MTFEIITRFVLHQILIVDIPLDSQSDIPICNLFVLVQLTLSGMVVLIWLIIHYDGQVNKENSSSAKD